MTTKPKPGERPGILLLGPSRGNCRLVSESEGPIIELVDGSMHVYKPHSVRNEILFMVWAPRAGDVVELVTGPLYVSEVDRKIARQTVEGKLLASMADNAARTGKTICYPSVEFTRAEGRAADFDLSVEVAGRGMIDRYTLKALAW